VAFDRDSQAVDIVKPDRPHRPRLSVAEDYRLADKLRVRRVERMEKSAHGVSQR
jgi:hypothetical protein